MRTETASIAVAPSPPVTESSVRVTKDLQRLREATGQVVGHMFFGTMLKQMRESKLKGVYGHGGRGEEAFSAQLHGAYAERMGTSMQRGLPEAVYSLLEPQQRRISLMSAEFGTSSLGKTGS